MKTDSDTTGDTVITVSVGRGETVTPGCHIHYHYLLISGVSRPGNDHLQFYRHNLAANYLDTFTYIALKSSDTRRHIKAKYSTVQYSHPCLCPEPCIVVTGTLGMLLYCNVMCNGDTRYPFLVSNSKLKVPASLAGDILSRWLV